MDRRAVTVVEYSMIAAILAAALIVVVSNIGHQQTGTYNTISGEL
jgi:Flp pilus assembly pilin Flp